MHRSFPENAEPVHIHFYFSVLFFVFFPISAFVSTVTFIQMGRKKLGLFTILIALIATFVWTIPFGKGVAIPENNYSSFGFSVDHDIKRQVDEGNFTGQLKPHRL